MPMQDQQHLRSKEPVHLKQYYDKRFVRFIESPDESCRMKSVRLNRGHTFKRKKMRTLGISKPKTIVL